MANDHGDIAGLYSRTGLSPNSFINFEEENCVIPAICGVVSNSLASPLPLLFRLAPCFVLEKDHPNTEANNSHRTT